MNEAPNAPTAAEWCAGCSHSRQSHHPSVGPELTACTVYDCGCHKFEGYATAAEVGMNIRKCEQCGRLSAPAGKPCAYCGAIATATERRYPEIPDGRMCESCGSLRYHATFCEKAPPMIRAGIRHHFDLLDIQLRQLGVVDDPDLRRYRDELGKAVGLVSQLYDAALLAARREEETMRSAAQGALDAWLQHAEMAEEWSAIGTLRAALAATPEPR